MQDQAIDQFIERVAQMTKLSGALATAISGVSSKTQVKLDLLKAASMLPQAKVDNKLDEQVQEVIGVLHVTQAMNVIGSEDLIELMELLEKINEEK